MRVVLRVWENGDQVAFLIRGTWTATEWSYILHFLSLAIPTREII